MFDLEKDMLPCPFCGGNSFSFPWNELNRVRVVCDNCALSTGLFRNPIKAARFWNNRYQPEWKKNYKLTEFSGD